MGKQAIFVNLVSISPLIFTIIIRIPTSESLLLLRELECCLQLLVRILKGAKSVQIHSRKLKNRAMLLGISYISDKVKD